MRCCRSILPLVGLLAVEIVAFAQLPPQLRNALAGYTEWSFTDPAYLYLVFTIQGCPGQHTGFVHPMMHGCGSGIIECFKPDHQQDARAFSYQLPKQTLQGYEVSFQPSYVSFQPMDPKRFDLRPLPDKDIKVFFPRSKRTVFKLTDKIEVVGFYGSPTMKHP